MAVQATLVVNDGREFKLGKFNEGKRTDTQIAHAVGNKYRNMIKRLGLHGHTIKLEHKDGSVSKVPLEQVKESL